MIFDRFRQGQALILAAALIIPAVASQTRAAEPVSAHYQELFFDAARAGRVDLLHGMVKDGVPVDVHDAQGYTALILAAYDDHLDAVSELLADGADPCATDAKGNNALMGVAFKGNLPIAQALLPHCDVNALNKQGQSALMMAALFGHADIVRLLVEHGAQVEAKDAGGNSALSLALQQGNAPMADLLRKLAADGASTR
jgi:ankyrin repeat protein